MEDGDVLGVKDLQDIHLEMDVNIVDNQGHTTLYLGAVDGCTKIVRILHQNGAITEFADSIGRKPLFTVGEKGQVEGHQGLGEEGC